MNANHAMRMLIAGAALLGSVQTTSAANTINVEWNNTLLNAIRVTKPGPPMTARAISIVHTCVYDAWAAYDGRANGTQLGGALRQPSGARTDANKRKAISYAAYKALVDLYPTRKADFDAKLVALGYTPSDSTNTSTPEGVANTACGAVLTFRHADGSNQLGNAPNGTAGKAYSDYTGYQPVNTPSTVNDVNRWQPLLVGGVTQKFITPHWRNVAPFALTSASQFLPPPPVAYGSSKFLAQSRDILNISAHLTDRQKMMAEYWADGPASELPPGHWTLFATFVSERDKHTVDQDTKMFFALGNALLDASIVCWDAKVIYDASRPVTTIRYLFAGQPVRAWDGAGRDNTLIDGANWKPYQPANFPTPPFAEYASGHSTFSSAAAVVLRNFTGSDQFGVSVTLKQGSSIIEPGVVPAQDLTLYWKTFRDAADDAGISRRYGGIHFKDGDLVARTMGAKVGEQVWRKAQQLFGEQSDDREAGTDH